MSTKKTNGRLVKSYKKVEVIEWEMVGVVKGRQIFQYELQPIPKDPEVGIITGTTKASDDFVLAIKSHPDFLFNVELEIGKTGICRMKDARSYPDSEV